MTSPSPLTLEQAGFGLGLRPPHYSEFQSGSNTLDWLEIVTDNFLVAGGKPLVMLDRIRSHTPVVMHGVAMAIGSSAPLDMAYLQQVKQLADRVEPLWVSDHLCWTGHGPHQLHDLFPIPYTEAAAKHVVDRICRAQDVLKRRLVIENVSSYVTYQQSTAAEWDFLAHVAHEADCLLLLDVNNVYVSSVNHGFDPLDYLRGLPAQRIQQIHLAGHADHGSHIVDTHDHPVAEPVWALYAQACALLGPVPTMVERDANIPPLAELLAEVQRARDTATQHVPERTAHTAHATTPALVWAHSASAAPNLDTTQALIAQHVLQAEAGTPSPALGLVCGDRPQALTRLGVYHHAYRARLSEVLGDSFPKTRLYMGDGAFDAEAVAFVVAHPPTNHNLARYGQGLVDHLVHRYPSNTELHELAQLDWDLRTRFDGPDAPALDPDQAAADTQAAWVQQALPLHPSLCLRTLTTNAVQLWHAMDQDGVVPPPVRDQTPCTLAVWRRGLQPHFQTVPAPAGDLLGLLAAGHSIQTACEVLVNQGAVHDPSAVGACLREWLEMGMLRAGPPFEAV